MVIEHIASALIDAIRRGAKQIRLRNIEANEQQRQSIIKSLYNLGHQGGFEGDDLVIVIDIKNRRRNGAD